MKININGELKTINQPDEKFFLENLITYLSYQPQLVVVELNGTIVNPQEWAITKIKDLLC